MSERRVEALYCQRGGHRRLRLEYKDAIALLSEEGIEIGLGDDLTVERQYQLGRIIGRKVSARLLSFFR